MVARIIRVSHRVRCGAKTNHHEGDEVAFAGDDVDFAGGGADAAIEDAPAFEA
jgi:hypothetical protein